MHNAELASAARQLRDMWEHKVWTEEPLGPGWNTAFADWIQKFGYGRVVDALQMVSMPRFSEDGERLPPDIRDIPKFAAVEQAEEREPGMRECYLVRGRIRKKFYCTEDDDDVLALLRRLLRDGVSPTAMHQAVDEAHTIEECFVSLGLDRVEFRMAMGQAIDDVLPMRLILIREEDPEWQLWDAHWRRTRGTSLPTNKQFGWYVPSRLPPADPPTKKAKR
jgi:hypothetical protein